MFWVHASNAARLEQGYRDIADVVKIAGRENPKADIFKLVHDWLRGYEGTWLMILDNVDDADFLLNTQASIESQPNDPGRHTLRPLRDYLPQSQNGSILITTRSRESALKLSEQNDLVLIDPMDESDAVELLEKKLESIGRKSIEEYVELAAALEFIPLAIVQAAAYISQGESRCSVQQYLAKFRKSDSKKISLLNNEGGQVRRDWDAKNSILVTWEISFGYIHRARPSAADLLSLMSFFDRQSIPESLLKDRAQAEKGPRSRNERYPSDGQRNSNEDNNNSDSDSGSMSEPDKDDEFEKDVRMLRDYLFISFDTNQTFEMHALVQLATRKWLEANKELETWKQRYIKNLSAEFPTGEHENWTYCRALFPHAKSAIMQRPRGEESLREWASLLHNAGWYAWRKGSILEAVELSHKAMTVRQKTLGQEHEDTLSSMGMMGLAYSLGGQWTGAEELQVQVMETRQRVLGQEHPDTLTSKANLASTYWNQGRWKEAEELEVQVMETSQRVLGQEHPDTLTSMKNLAFTWKGQDRATEAISLLDEYVQLQLQVLGLEHPDTEASLKILHIWQGRTQDQV